METSYIGQRIWCSLDIYCTEWLVCLDFRLETNDGEIDKEVSEG